MSVNLIFLSWTNHLSSWETLIDIFNHFLTFYRPNQKLELRLRSCVKDFTGPGVFKQDLTRFLQNKIKVSLIWILTQYFPKTTFLIYIDTETNVYADTFLYTVQHFWQRQKRAGLFKVKYPVFSGQSKLCLKVKSLLPPQSKQETIKQCIKSENNVLD